MNRSIGRMTKIGQKKSGEMASNEAKTSKATDMHFNSSMKNLLFCHDETIEDKIATVKTAQIVDRGRFEIALKVLMKR